MAVRDYRKYRGQRCFPSELYEEIGGVTFPCIFCAQFGTQAHGMVVCENLV